MTAELLAIFIASSIRLAAPLIFAAVGELVSERAGVLNLSLEGMMLAAAFGGALGAFVTGSPWVGLLTGVLFAVVVSAVQAVFSVSLRANQIVVGIGINIVVLGATTVASRGIFGRDPGFSIEGFGKLNFEPLSNLPILGTALFQQTGLVYLAPVLALLVWWLLYRSTAGIAIRAAGDEPKAADKSGVAVPRIRWLAILFTGILAGFGGAIYSIADIHSFTENMTGGVGYLAIAAVIFGRWRVLGTFVACLVFGAATSLQFQLPAMGIALVPVALLVMLPYALALLAVSGLVGRQSPPRALTIPFFRR
ncbi:ABC transporter permease [Ferrovibrio terrae]|uniref:ABC transporter permease n=1 Tax=Ferrovibrio terrae TaxID=2594003 RepID=UPI00313820E8